MINKESFPQLIIMAHISSKKGDSLECDCGFKKNRPVTFLGHNLDKLEYLSKL
jgi:hypothetical protein